MQKHGLTLLEMLIGILLLITLVMLLFPVLPMAWGKGQKIHCQGNLKHIMQAAQIYAGDYKERLPFYRNPCWDEWQYHPHWFALLSTYLPHQQVLSCPSAVDCGVCNWSCWPQNQAFNSPQRIHYGYNECICNDCCRMNELSHIRFPQETVVFGDCLSRLLTPWAYPNWNAKTGIPVRFALANARPRLDCCPTLPSDPIPYTRHAGGSNAAFGDGHVKWVRWDQTKRKEQGGTLRYGPTENF